MTLVSHRYESAPSASATRPIMSGASARPAKRFAGGSIFPCAVGAPFLLIRLQLVCVCAAITVLTGVGQTATVGVGAPYLTGQVPDPIEVGVVVVVVVVLLPLVYWPAHHRSAAAPTSPLAYCDWPQSSIPPRKKVQALGEPAPRRSPSIPSPQIRPSLSHRQTILRTYQRHQSFTQQPQLSSTTTPSDTEFRTGILMA